jgi:hypothetical protein
LELKDKIEINKKNRRNLSQRTQELCKEYSRTQQLHQQNKTENLNIEEEEEVQAKGIHIYSIK